MTVSTKEYGCFFCGGKSNNREGHCPLCGEPINIGADLLGTTIARYKVLDVLGRGFYGWTFKVEDSFQAFAMKVVPVHRLSPALLTAKEARALEVLPMRWTDLGPN
jgi:hypothetical protein